MKFKRSAQFLFSLMILAQLSGCISIARKVQNTDQSFLDTYPSVPAKDPKVVETPPTVNLSNYKSVHSRFQDAPDTAIALAASGGGYRAANLTLGVMLGLEKLRAAHANKNLLEAVDYYSSVSGGGLAIGYYLDQFYSYQLNHSADNFSLDKLVSNFKQNKKNPLRDDLSRYLFFGKDRGLALEAHLGRSLFVTPSGEMTLGDIFVPKTSAKPVRLPYWVANATIYQNVAIFPFTPDVIADYAISGYFHNNKYQELIDPYDLPVSIGATASSSIPFITPSTTLTSNGCKDTCYIHLVDGGIADNLAVYTALSMLHQDESKTKILIVVDASKSVSQPYSKLKESPATLETFERLVGASCDVNRQHLKPNLELLTRKLLKNKHTSKIYVVYLDLDEYPEAQKIATKLALSSHEQQLLIKTGEELVLKNPRLRELAQLI